MNKTAIEWCDMTWSPVTGCLHDCPYCYARGIARRFAGGGYGKEMDMFIAKYKDGVFNPPYELSEPQLAKTKDDWYRQAPYPFGFEPTLHRYRLNEPQRKKKPQNIFVCSMADLFGKWVPDEWIKAVFDACAKAPWHRYLFLTKNPERYVQLYNTLPTGNNFYFGTTATTEDTEYWFSANHNWFLSIEPIMGRFSGDGFSGNKPLWEGQGINPKWVIVGVETGNRKGKVIPEKEWIEVIVNECRKNGVPVFLKDSIKEIWGEPLIQEYPWTGGKGE